MPVLAAAATEAAVTDITILAQKRQNKRRQQPKYHCNDFLRPRFTASTTPWKQLLSCGTSSDFSSLSTTMERPSLPSYSLYSQRTEQEKVWKALPRTSKNKESTNLNWYCKYSWLINLVSKVYRWLVQTFSSLWSCTNVNRRLGELRTGSYVKYLSEKSFPYSLGVLAFGGWNERNCR